MSPGSRIGAGVAVSSDALASICSIDIASGSGFNPCVVIMLSKPLALDI